MCIGKYADMCRYTVVSSYQCIYLRMYTHVCDVYNMYIRIHTWEHVHAHMHRQIHSHDDHIIM